MSFIDDVRQIQKVREFEGGNNNQRAKLNGLVKAVSDIVDAANRNVPDPAANLPAQGEAVIWINDAGTAVQYRFVAEPI